MGLKEWKERARRLRALAERGWREEGVVRQAVERLERWIGEPSEPRAGAFQARGGAREVDEDQNVPSATAAERPPRAETVPTSLAFDEGEATPCEGGTDEERTLPLATATLARLLASQGKLALAVEVADRVLAEGEDEALSGARRQWVERLAAEVSEARMDRGAEVECRLDVASEGGLTCGWRVDPVSVRRAERYLGAEGVARLALRLVTWRASADGRLVREQAEWPIEASNGVRHVSGVPSGSRVVAAVGVRRGERFVSVAHAGPVRVS